MAELPSGTVTLLFTDIEGSTRLLQELGGNYPEVLSEHRRLLRAAFAAHEGVEVDTQGDAFFVAFRRARDAVAAAIEAQGALRSSSVRVRMGVHTGEPVVREGGYVGIDVHRGARICAAGHGGQVLLSDATRRALGPDAHVRDLGEHRLKDLPAPEWLFQLLGPDLGDRFPPLRSLNNTNLPMWASSLVGRERELAEIGALVSRLDVRLVTLTGPGGTGKTRLAVSVAASLVELFRNGVFLVELAAVVEATQLLPTIARTVGARESGDDLVASLGQAFEGKATLLVLDNLEQIVIAAPDIARLLEAADGLKVLATSRERLRISGEHEYAVEPLPVDQAVELFDTRARAIVPGFRLDAQRERVVALCRRLDGLPLAIELAAARVKVLTPEAMLARLEQQLPVLGVGPRDLPRRQQTLRATIDWSYALLATDEQQLFARLSTFAGGFSTGAAEVVCGASVDQLASLLDKNLLRQGDTEGDPRFSMLETIREYATAQLHDGGAADQWRRGHAMYHASLAKQAQDEMFAGGRPSAGEVATSELFGGPNETAALDRLAAERDNLTAALAWFIEQRNATSAVALVLDLGRLWLVRGTLADGRRWTERVIGLEGADETSDFGWLLTVAAEFPRWQGDVRRARALIEQALAALDASNEEAKVEAAKYTLAMILATQMDFSRARVLLEEALVRGRASHDSVQVSRSLNGLGTVAFREGDYERMAAFADEELELARRSRSPNSIMNAAHNVAEARRHLGELGPAATRYGEAMNVSGKLGDESLLAECFDGLADVSAALGDPASAATLWAAAQRIFNESGFDSWDPEGQRRGIEAARVVLGDEAFEAQWRTGLALTVEEAVARALLVVARAAETA